MVDVVGAVLVWVLNNLVLVLEDWLIVGLVVSVSVAVEGLHESLGLIVLCLEEGVTELSEGGSEAVQLISQCIGKGVANSVLGSSEGLSLFVEECVEPLFQAGSLVSECRPDTLNSLLEDLVLKINLLGQGLPLVVILNSRDEVSLVGLLLSEDSCGFLNACLESFSLSLDLVAKIRASGSSSGLPLSELGCQEALEGLCSGGGTRCGSLDSKVTRLCPCDPCGLNSLLKDDSLVVELVEELVSVTRCVLIAVVLVLQGVKSSLNSVVLGLNVGKKSSCQVSISLDESIDLSSELLSLVCGAAILLTYGLFPLSIGVCLLCFFPLGKPFKGGDGLGLLRCSHVVDVFLYGVDVFVFEVLSLWLLVVWTWLVTLVSILTLEELLQ